MVCYIIIYFLNKNNILYYRYVVVFHTERTKHSADANSTRSYLIFTEDGDIINRWTINGRVPQQADYEVLGHRLFHLDSNDNWFVTSQKIRNSSTYVYMYICLLHETLCIIFNHTKFIL